MAYLQIKLPPYTKIHRPQGLVIDVLLRPVAKSVDRSRRVHVRHRMGLYDTLRAESSGKYLDDVTTWARLAARDE